jgi:hypothetical protein
VGISRLLKGTPKAVPDTTGDGWGDGWGMGEELHEEMSMGCTTIFFLRSRECRRYCNITTKMKNTNPCLHILKELCKQKK